MGIKHSRPVPPFMRYCSAIIPTMFDDSLSYYEALCALNRFIQKNLVEVINNNATVTQEYINLTNQLKEYMENYFENLDVQTEINNKLDSMAEDGTLGELINQVLFESKMSAYKPLSADVTLQYADKGNTQTITHTTDGKFCMVEIGADDNSNILKEYNSEGTLLRQITFTAYHPNSICYYNGYIYVANAYSTTGGVQSDVNVITRINLSNLIVDTIDVGHPVKTIAVYDDKFYCLTENVLKVYNNDFTTLYSTDTIPNYGDIYQGIVVNEHHIILSCSYSFIVFFNHDLTLDKILNIRNFDFIPAGELQDIDYYDDQVWLLTSKTLGGGRTYWYCGSFNYLQGNVNKPQLNPNVNQHSNKTLFAKSTYTGVKQIGTQSNPFVEIEQAVFAIYNPYISYLTISVFNGSYSNVNLTGISKPLTIIGREQKVSTLINAFYIDRCTYIRLENMTISSVYNVDDYNYGIYADKSNLDISNITFSNNHSIRFANGTLITGYSIGVTGSNSMSVADAVYISHTDLPTNFKKAGSVICNKKAVLFESVDGEDITNTINLTGYSLSAFKTLKLNLKITSAGTSTVWYKTVFADVKANNKIDIFLKASTDSILWWSVLTLVMNLSNNRITGSSQWTTNLDGTNVSGTNQPVIKLLSVEEV